MNEEIKDTLSQTEVENELTLCKQRLLFFQAELENYKKRVEKERSSWINRAEDQVITDGLPVIDDMERAFNEQQQTSEVQDQQSVSVHVKGFELIYKGLQKFLKEYQVEEIPYCPDFNPELYEAVMQVPAEGKETGTVVSILKKGYRRHGRILRPAQVSVAL